MDKKCKKALDELDSKFTKDKYSIVGTTFSNLLSYKTRINQKKQTK